MTDPKIGCPNISKIYRVPLLMWPALEGPFDALPVTNDLYIVQFILL